MTLPRRGNLELYLLAYAAVVGGLTTTSPLTRKCLFGFLAAAVVALFQWQPRVRLHPTMEYQIAFQICVNLVYAIDILLVNDPHTTLQETNQKTPPSSLPVLKRAWWATRITFNPRGIKWNVEAPHLYRLPLGKFDFIKYKIKWCIIYFLTVDLLGIYASKNPALHPPGSPMGANGFGWQVVEVVTVWSLITAGLQLNHSILAIVAVATGIWEPSDWPEWFGPWGETTSVRKFWGQTWHQSLRRQLVSPGKLVARAFRFKPGTKSSRYTQLYIAFFMSGVFHAIGDWAINRNPVAAWRNIIYFTIQAVAITAEDIVIALAKRSGIKFESKIVSYVWVLLWLSWSCPIWMELVVSAGMANMNLPFSVIRKIFPQLA